ncbi:Peptide chain release factor 1 [Aeoliella mucimassa]|uniref:Peptide chain release factor 1 n=1 Tax=Aeoliella mucimassa TaxID=2527972 RepID=A0A518AK96_9BACT|nr:peptide chain release factor-like protein [Aeoliella mucimassa]QDU55158.1 Peptide chain release factor 1 [Aeoliella mucimassa]
MTHPAQLDPQELAAQCKATTTRRSGPGGQHRNKVETAVVLTHEPTGISAEANERRSQQANREQALERLRLRLAVEFRTAVEPLSERWKRRTQGGRIAVNVQHEDYAALVAEALNHLAAHDFDTRQAADQLGVSATQLVNLLKKSTSPFTRLNQERTERGLHPLK